MLNIASGLFGQLVTICCGIIIPRLVIVSYGSEVNGLLNSITQILVYFSLFEAGVGTASVQALYGPVARNDRKEIQSILVATKQFYLKTGFLYLGAVILLSLLYPFLLHTEIPYWKIVAIIFFGGAGNCLNFFYQSKYTVLMSAEGNSYVYTNIVTIISVLTSISKVVLLLMGFNIIAVQLSYFILCFVQMFFYFLHLRKHYAWIDWHVEPNQVAISQKNATLVHQVAGIIFNNTDTLVLTAATGDLKIVSVYTIYNMVISMITTLVQQLSTGINFKMGQLFNTNRKQYLVLHHVFELIFMTLAFATMTTAYLLFPAFIKLYTANVSDVNYLERFYPLFFSVIPLFTIGRTSLVNLINYSGHFKQTQWRAVIESVLNVIVSIFGVIRFGLYGVLLGSLVAVLYRTVDLIFYCYKHILEDTPWRTIKRWLVCFVAFALMVVLTPEQWITAGSYLHLVGYGVLVGGCSLITYFLLLCVTNPKEAKNLKEIIDKEILHR